MTTRDEGTVPTPHGERFILEQMMAEGDSTRAILRRLKKMGLDDIVPDSPAHKKWFEQRHPGVLGAAVAELEAEGELAAAAWLRHYDDPWSFAHHIVRLKTDPTAWHKEESSR